MPKKHIVAIDPGPKNTALVMLCAETKRVLDHAKISIPSSLSTMDGKKFPPHESLLRNVCEIVLPSENTGKKMRKLHERFFSRPEEKVFLIERQQWPTNHDIELTFYGKLHPHARLVSASSVKSHFGFSKKHILAFAKARPGTAKRWNLTRKRMKAKIKSIQKRTAVFVAAVLCKQAHWILKYNPKMDDVSDAYLVALKYAQEENEDEDNLFLLSDIPSG